MTWPRVPSHHLALTEAWPGPGPGRRGLGSPAHGGAAGREARGRGRPRSRRPQGAPPAPPPRAGRCERGSPGPGRRSTLPGWRRPCWGRQAGRQPARPRRSVTAALRPRRAPGGWKRAAGGTAAPLRMFTERGHLARYHTAEEAKPLRAAITASTDHVTFGKTEEGKTMPVQPGPREDRASSRAYAFSPHHSSTGWQPH